MTLEAQNDVLALPDKDSAITADSYNSNPEPSCLPQLDTPSAFLKIYHQKETYSTISPKMTRKAVNWLLSIAWSKDYCFETGWTALMLFYGYKAQKNIKKQQLESLLLICLQLASKVHESVPLKLSEVLLCCTNPISREELLEMEGEILQLFNYEIYQPNMLEIVAAYSNLDEESIMKILFLAELYLTRDISILFDAAKCRKLMQMVKGVEINEGYQLQLLQIQELAFDPLNRIQYNKFGSKFDIELFLSQFQ